MRQPPPLPDPPEDPEERASEDDADAASIIERPDGFYWLAGEGLGEVGPFETYEAAEADRDSAGDDTPEPGETLEEAEQEIGINPWLDSETGMPAEGQSPPRLDND